MIAETNAEWWTGRSNGSEGLFPSNYVERLPPTALAYPRPHSQPLGYPGNQYHTPLPNHYQVTNQAGSFAPAPYGISSPPGSQQVIAQGEPQKPPKKNFLSGSLGNTVRPSLWPSLIAHFDSKLAHSAVGGVGFGAGMCSYRQRHLDL